jgi:ADP-ribose pyrophosphatase
MSPWKRLTLEEILSEPVRLVRERLLTHTGKEITYIYRPGPVAASFVLPVTEEATALLIRQYRHPTGKFLLEVPAGKVDPGETPMEAAKRELMEEVGAEAQTYLPLPPFHPQPSFTAVGLPPLSGPGGQAGGPASPRGRRTPRARGNPLAELYALLERGEVQDASTALTLFYARPHLKARGLL